VELRIVGPRDVAKMLCGMGACGIESRCCSRFLSEFSSISIRMAKEQGISLTPTEITGMCGRLRCCLIYEYEMYVQARQGLPKRNKRVITPKGEGKVLDVSPIRQAVYVELLDGYVWSSTQQICSQLMNWKRYNEKPSLHVMETVLNPTISLQNEHCFRGMGRQI